MSLLDLGLTDVRRVAAALSDIADQGGDSPSMGDLLKDIADKFKVETLAGRSPVETVERGGESRAPMFSNPPFPLTPSSETTEAVLRVRDRVRKAIVSRYGEEYADELWAKLSK